MFFFLRDQLPYVHFTYMYCLLCCHIDLICSYIINSTFFLSIHFSHSFNPCRSFVFTLVCFYLQEKEGCHSSLYTLKWFMQCFLDRVCSIAACCVWCACIVVRDPTFAHNLCCMEPRALEKGHVAFIECFHFTTAIVVSQNSETAITPVMLLYQTNPVGVQLFSQGCHGQRKVGEKH